ncbi:N-acetylglucosaminyl deacetylase [Actinokineospora auranticolor]|uniref:LmbE family N-acetylglucosaminyl deacetylase n=1 Tax=Actinokineospora auranticolor TaxID=155976 RepID=A0A2S6GUE7_9PSEU|nr:PIG-L family deacetylase [Actinokineospora auranticolor]PPK68817.1 LmbE family N-acetylglucosaminyl deacetylase [Actinokineospora auranticolor]
MSQASGQVRFLAVSPHLDDAVLSYGAGLAQAGRDGADVLVHTVFAGSASPPYSAAAQRLHELWGLAPDQDASLVRRAEDAAALDHLGAAHRHGRFLDSIYRRLPDGRWLAENVAGKAKLRIDEHSPEHERELRAAVEDDIRAVVAEVVPTLVVTCAAINAHVDNRITRDAALAVAGERGIPVRLWEDLPHATFGSDEVELPAGFHLGDAEFGAVEEESRTRKFESLKYYTSQLLMLDGPNKDLFALLDEHARKSSPRGGYGETTWPVSRGAGDS